MNKIEERKKDIAKLGKILKEEYGKEVEYDF